MGFVKSQNVAFAEDGKTLSGKAQSGVARTLALGAGTCRALAFLSALCIVLTGAFAGTAEAHADSEVPTSVYTPTGSVWIRAVSDRVEHLSVYTRPDDVDYSGKVHVASSDPSVVEIVGNSDLQGVETGSSYAKYLYSVRYRVRKEGSAVITVSFNGHPEVKGDTVDIYVGKGQPVYRLYNPFTNEHFYTESEHERDVLDEAGWNYEGVGWRSWTDGTEVHRMLDPVSYDHHYTKSQYEISSLAKLGWIDEGVAFYSKGTVPVYREFNPNVTTGAHNYTSSEHEDKTLGNLGWKREGYAWSSVF